MTRRGRLPALVALFLLIVPWGLSPAAALGPGGETTAKPCAGVGGMPPTVHADPSCLVVGGDASTDFKMVQPVAKGVHVHLSWNFSADGGHVQGFVIYRGASPVTLHAIGHVGPGATEYMDWWAMVKPGTSWYAVGAIVDGVEVRSAAHMVQVVQ